MMGGAWRLFRRSGIRESLHKITPELFMRFGLSLATFLENKGEVIVASRFTEAGRVAESGRSHILKRLRIQLS